MGQPTNRQLNPIEHMGDYLRENTCGNKTLDHLEDVVNQLCYGLNHLDHHPETVPSLTCFDWLNTLCLTGN